MRDRAPRHLAAENLAAIQVDHAAIVTQQPDMQAGNILRIRHQEMMAEIRRNEKVPGGSGANNRRFVAVTVAQLSRPEFPPGVAEGRGYPIRSLVRPVIEESP